MYYSSRRNHGVLQESSELEHAIFSRWRLSMPGILVYTFQTVAHEQLSRSSCAPLQPPLQVICQSGAGNTASVVRPRIHQSALIAAGSALSDGEECLFRERTRGPGEPPEVPGHGPLLPGFREEKRCQGAPVCFCESFHLAQCWQPAALLPLQNLISRDMQVVTDVFERPARTLAQPPHDRGVDVYLQRCSSHTPGSPGSSLRFRNIKSPIY